MKTLFYSLLAIMTFSTGTAKAGDSIVASDRNLSPLMEPAAIQASEPKTVVAGQTQTDEPSGWQKVLDRLPKISGYLQTGYQYNSLGKHSSSFQAKRLRLIADGNVSKNVSFRLQIEAFNGIAGTTNGRGQKNLQVMDAFATMKISDAVKLRAGQFYLPIGYENYDISPATLETVDFSDICYRMVCRNPIAYDWVDYGRDLGVMIFGDVAPSSEGFNYLSYNFSVTNGSLPSKDDNNKSKDLVAALTFRPIKNLSIKGAFNWGQYAGTVGTETYENQDMTRYVLGAWYNQPAGLDLRAEYGHMASSHGGQSIIKEDGFYALGAYHFGPWMPMVRYAMYRDKVNKSTLNNYDSVLFGLTYHLNKNLKFQANYMLTMYTDEAKVTNNDKGSSSKLQVMGIYRF
jgi:predicted porin